MHEIPDNLKNLYRHWPNHTIPKPYTALVNLDPNVLSSIELFIAERMSTWHRKTNALIPYTTDPVISQYRFCNIYRELDKQTIAIHFDLKDIRDDFPLWLLNVAFHRFICNPQTVQAVGRLSFNSENNNQVFERLLNTASPKYGSAYIFPISTIQKSDYPTREKLFCLYLPQAIPSIAEFIQNQKHAGIADLIDEIMRLFGFKLKFHWTEILIDVAYQYPEYINLFERFPIGPGSAPTMKLLNHNVNGELVAINLVNYQPQNFPYLTYNGRPIWLSAENWEGIGCEFRKYVNLKNGSGRKRKYG